MTPAELVLLVDDIPDHLTRYSAALRDDGLRVEIARAGAEALSLAREHLPDCCVIDLRLPDMTGWELCTALKADRDTRLIPVVILTPDVSRAWAADSAKVGCSAWLAQPSIGGDLVRTVRHVLAQTKPSPLSEEEALVGVVACPACDSESVRATLRVSLIQYYLCRACGHCWRVEAL
jgi:CheY-like chemotaxis protein